MDPYLRKAHKANWNKTSAYSHKRSKSSLALSMLHREKSKSDDKVDNGADLDGASSWQPPSPNSEPARHSMSPSMASFRSKRKPGPEPASTLNTPSSRRDETEDESKETRDMAGRSAGPVASGGASIEQSVRTFRLFEILRAGDTTAISRAIKECKASQDQGNAGLGTTILHLAIQCAEPQVVEYVLSSGDDIDINARDREGNTPLHLAAQLGRLSVVRELLDRPSIYDAAVNYQGQTPLDLARTPEIFQQLQLARSLFIDAKTREIQTLVAQGDYEKLEQVLIEPRVEAMLDINSPEFVVDRVTALSGGTLLHEAARKRDIKLIQLLLMHGADPFRRDKKGKLPQDVTKDDRTRNIVKKSPAAVMAQRGIQEKAILGTAAGQQPGEVTVGGRDAREMKGYLKKWTNYTSGYKLRWFVLEDGVLSYYKHQGLCFAPYPLTLFLSRSLTECLL
jgi:splicing suppressor protein 51